MLPVTRPLLERALWARGPRGVASEQETFQQLGQWLRVGHDGCEGRRADKVGELRL